jgi:hypothetical protein
VAEVFCILTLFWHYLFVDSIGMAATLKAFWNSPVGPKTTHFWGPVANWGFVVAGLADTQKPPDMISENMTGGMLTLLAIGSFSRKRGTSVLFIVVR